MYEKRDGNLIGCWCQRFFLAYLILAILRTDHSSQGGLLYQGLIIPNE